MESELITEDSIEVDVNEDSKQEVKQISNLSTGDSSIHYDSFDELDLELSENEVSSVSEESDEEDCQITLEHCQMFFEVVKESHENGSQIEDAISLERIKKSKMVLIMIGSSLSFVAVSLCCYMKTKVWEAAKVIGDISFVICFVDRDNEVVQECVHEDWVWIKDSQHKSTMKEICTNMKLPQVIVASADLTHCVTLHGENVILHNRYRETYLRNWMHAVETRRSEDQEEENQMEEEVEDSKDSKHDVFALLQ